MLFGNRARSRTRLREDGGPFPAENMKLKTGILGVTGYVGQQLLSILSVHPEVDLRLLTSEKFSGKTADDAFPHLAGRVGLPLVSVSKTDVAGPLDLVFSCLPAGTSAVFVEKFLERGAKVIDLGPDLRDGALGGFAEAGGAGSGLFSRAVYGLCELNREKIRGAEIVANPGCYSTCVLLAIAPFLDAADMDGGIVVDLKSSVSTSGRAARLESHFSESAAEVSVEDAGGHGQKDEILRALGGLRGGLKTRLVLVNTRVPVKRGIMAVSYLKLRSRIGLEEAVGVCREFYEKEIFVRVLESGVPRLSDVAGSNFIDMGFGLQEDRLIAVSVLDNLMKGAAGQAVQNMNVVFGFPEDEGLGRVPVFP